MAVKKWGKAGGDSIQAMPFANRPPAAGSSGEIVRFLDIGPSPGQLFISDDIIWRPLNGRAMLYHRNRNPITIQNLSTTTAETVTFPGGLVRAGMRVNVDMRAHVGAIGVVVRRMYTYIGLVGSPPSAGYVNTSLSNMQQFVRGLTTVECLQDDSGTHLGGPNAVSGAGMQYSSSSSGIATPTIDFSLPWEVRARLQSAAETAVNITSASWSGNVVTFGATGHTLVVGDKTVVAGVTPSGYNGTYIVLTVPEANTFTAELLSDPGAYTSGGTSSRVSNMILQTLTITLEG